MKNTAKKAFALILAIVTVLSLSLSGCKKSDKDLLARIKEKGTLEMGTEGDWAPWTYHDQDDNLVGFDVELGKAVAEYIGVEAKISETDWDSILAGVDSGRFDTAFNGVAYTEERAKKYDFSKPYAFVDTVLIVREDTTDINSLDDLKGKKTANTISSQYAKIAEEHGATVVGVNTILETIEQLVTGRVDATLHAAVSFNDYIKEHPEAPIKVVATVAREQVVCPVKKGDDTKSFLDQVNACIDEMRASGKLAELSEKYYGMDITKE